MSNTHVSLEACRWASRLMVLVLLLAVAAHLLSLVDPGWLLLVVAPLCLLLAVGLLVGLAQIFRLLNANREAAQRILTGNYATSFPVQENGLAGGMQESLAAMVDRMKHDLGLARGIMNSMVTPCAVADIKENFIFGNPALIRMVEQEGRPEDYYGNSIAHFFYGDASRPTVLGVAMREDKSISKEVVFTGRKGGKLDIHIDASPLYDLEGKIMGGPVRVHRPDGTTHPRGPHHPSE